MSVNGRLPKSELAPIPGGELEIHAAARWNANGGPADAGLLPTGPESSYRDFAGQVKQRNEWCSKGLCHYAAVPGTSVHGLGKAVDLKEPWMRAWIDEHGRPFGWAKTEAFHEWWHVNYIGPVDFPVFEVLSKGSKGKRVKHFTRRLAFIRPDGGRPYLARGVGRYGRRVVAAVEAFQVDQGLQVDGEIGPRTAARINAVFTRQWQRRHKDRRRGTHSSKASVAIEAAIKAPPPKRRRWKLEFAAPFISKWEGWLEYPYLDTIAEPDVWTAGYGHTGDDVVPGQRWSKAKSLRVLVKDIRWAAKAVSQHVHVPLTFRQRIALISLVFNCGPGAIDGSTLQRKLNARNYKGAANEFLRWCHAGGVVVEGLLNRRREERAMFLSRMPKGARR